MSRYEERIAVKEALRDPFDLNPPEDENEMSGVLRRKLSVSFGSKFNKDTSGKQIDSIQETLDIFGDTPAIYRDNDDNTSSETDKSRESSPNVETHLNGKSFPNFVIAKLTGGTRKRSSSTTDPKSVVADEPPSKVAAYPPRIAQVLDVQTDSENGSSNTSVSPKGSKSPASELVENDSHLSTEDRPLPEGWIKAFSNKQNKTYWYNVNTKKSVWEFPAK
jgi:WW domain